MAEANDSIKKHFNSKGHKVKKKQWKDEKPERRKVLQTLKSAFEKSSERQTVDLTIHEHRYEAKPLC